MANTFDSEYSATPWPVRLDSNQQTVWVPDLMAVFRRQSIFMDMVNYQIDMGAMRTQEVVWTQRLKSGANIASLDNRALWLPQIYADSRRLRIHCNHYGKNVAVPC